MTVRNESPGREQRTGQEARGLGLGAKPETSIPTRPLNVNHDDLISAIGQARDDLGLVISQPIADGQLHRCPALGGRPGSLDGAYRVCLDHPANVWGQNFRTGAKGVFPFGGSSSSWSPAQRREFAAKVEEDRKAREADQQAAWAVAAKKAELIYSEAGPCEVHPYLTAKGVNPILTLRASGRDLIVPLYDAYGILRSLQFIAPDGQKRFLKGGRKSGCYLGLIAGATNRRESVLICEGLATGLSLFQSTGFETLVAFDAGNLKAVALGARKDWPDRRLILCADNDCGSGSNVGVEKAREAALAVDGLLAVPHLAGGQPCDFNDLYRSAGPDTVRAFVEAAFIVEGQCNA